MSIKPAIENQCYHDDPPCDYAAERCRLDVYLPENNTDTKTPLLIFFHGGGLENDDRSQCLPMARGLLAAGIAVAIADYRLAPKAKVPDFITDAAAATSWVIKNVVKIGVDTCKIFCGGYSAGAYLAAMIVQDNKYLQQFDINPLEDLAGLIAVSGQMVTHKLVRSQLGLPDGKPVINEYAPIYHACEMSIPTLCIVADNDMPARMEENLYWLKLRKLAGNESDKIIVRPNRHHGNIINDSDNPEEPTTKAITEFILGY